MADRTLGKLCRKLRTLGFDVAYCAGGNTAEAAKIAQIEGRCLLTRSHKVPKDYPDLKFLIIEENDPGQQLRELFSKLNLLFDYEKLFSRCLICNEPIVSISKEEAEGRVPDFILCLYDSFHSCPSCHRVYWPGTHWEKMKKEMEAILKKHDKM